MPGSDHPQSNLTGDQALSLLREGNIRFIGEVPQHTRTTSELLAQTAEGQAPFGAVLACADSRVPVELIFDCGVGDLFVVRVAGNTVDPLTGGSIEFAVSKLGVPVVVVLGHTGCGAVSAAVERRGRGGGAGSISAVVEPILPACDEARGANPGCSGEALIDHAAMLNAKRQVEVLTRDSEIVRTGIERGTVRVVAALYDLKTGEVRWV